MFMIKSIGVGKKRELEKNSKTRTSLYYCFQKK